MLAVMKYDEKLREGCRSLGEARQTRERRAQLAETRPWKTGDQKTGTRPVQLAQQNVMILRQCLGSSSSFDYCSVHAAKRVPRVRIAQVPQCLTKTSLPFRLTSRSSQLSSAAPARSEAPLARIQAFQGFQAVQGA
jgi:hypothetical protein